MWKKQFRQHTQFRSSFEVMTAKCLILQIWEQRMVMFCCYEDFQTNGQTNVHSLHTVRQVQKAQDWKVFNGQIKRPEQSLRYF